MNMIVADTNIFEIRGSDSDLQRGSARAALDPDSRLVTVHLRII